MGWTEVVLRQEVAWAAGGLMIALAALLLVLVPRDRVARAFAVFLVLRGTANLPTSISNLYDNYRIIILPFVAVWFLVEYHRRTRLRKGYGWTLPTLAAAALGMVALGIGWWGLVMPDWFHVVNVFYAARFFTYALIAFVLARDALARHDAAGRWPLLLVSLAFALNPLHHVAVSIHGAGVWPVVQGAVVYPFFAQETPRLAAFLLVAGAAIMLSVRLVLNPDAQLRKWVVAYNVTLVAVVLSVLLSAAATPHRLGPSDPLAQAFDRIWTFPVPFVVGYVLLRARIFDIDIRLKATLVGGLMMAAFSTAFFVAQELLEDVLPATGALPGLMGAGLLAVAFVPLQRAARLAVDRLVPGVSRQPEYLNRRKLDVYRSALESALYDGLVTAKERRILQVLQSGLGVPDGEAARIEALVVEDRDRANALAEVANERPPSGPEGPGPMEPTGLRR